MLKHSQKIARNLLILFVLSVALVAFQPLLGKTVSKEESIREANKLAAGNKSYVNLTDLTYTTATSSWNDRRALQKDVNESGNDLISLIVNGEKKYFLKGLFAHAESTVIYDLTGLNFDTFSAYVGVDSTREGNGDGVKFTISVSNDQTDWVVKSVSETLKGNTEAYYVEADISGYKYLKLYASQLRNNTSDHAVYADAKLYNSKTYAPMEKEATYIKTVEEYDKILKGKTNEEILNKYELELLQRNFVQKTGYAFLQAFASGDEEKAEMMEWLFNHKEVLKKYTTGGAPLGTYMKSLDVLSKLYAAHKEDLKGSHKDVSLTMMLAISLTHSSDVTFWVSGEHNEKVVSNPVKRYEVLKKLYEEGLKGSVVFETKIFESLTVEEMRWVVDNQLSDEEIPWLNWYSTHTQPLNSDGTKNPLGTTKYSNRPSAHTSKNPYTYIAYYKGWNYYDPNYYSENAMCATDYRNKNESGYSRTASCEKEYHLKEWGIGTTSTSLPRLWIVWEEDGVCGSLSHTGSNLEAAYGNPTAVIGQPGHAAYLVSSRTYNEETKEWTVVWNIGNAAAGWAASEKGERFPLNWGSKANKWHSYYNVSYMILIQKALNNFDDYEASMMRLLVANVFETDIARRIQLYEDILKIQPYNLDGWYQLTQAYLQDSTKTPKDYYNLAIRIMNNMKEWPLPMVDLLKQIEGKISIDYLTAYNNNKKKTLQEMSTVANGVYVQSGVTRDMAKSLLGIEKNMEIASFSFDGEKANQLILNGDYEEGSVPTFEFSLNYNHERTWTQITDRKTTVVDLSKRLNELNAEDDIYVHIIGTDIENPDNLYVIDLKEAATPTGLYANDLENKVIGTTSTMEWQIKDTTKKEAGTWVKFADKLPDLSGSKTVLVRNGYAGTTLPGDSVELIFEADPEFDKTKSYISVSRLKATASSQQNEGEGALKAVDGNKNSYWHNRWDGKDTERWIKIEIDDVTEVSKIDYVPRQDSGVNGIITIAKIEVSLDDEHWTTVAERVEWPSNKTTKSYVFETPMKAKYVKITAVASVNNFASAAMINLYENKVEQRVSMDKVAISYVSGGYVFNGLEHTPHVSVSYGEQELILNEHYHVAYENNINAGTAKIKVTGLGIYDGTVEKEFIIAKAVKPSVTPEEKIMVDVSKKTLKDVTLPQGWSWEDNSIALKSGQTITAKAIYHDAKNYDTYTANVTITKEVGNHPVIETSQTSFVYDMNEEEKKDVSYFTSLVTITDVEDGKIDINDTSKVKITTDLDWSKEGTYHITIKVTDSDENTSTCVFQITLIDKKADPIDISNYKITINDESLVYDGTEKFPKIVIEDGDGHVLTANVDFVVAYKDNINAGEATVLIQGINIYSGAVTKTFNIKKKSVPSTLPSLEMSVSSDTNTIATILLPEGWAWKEEAISLKEGKNVLTVVFLGDANHERYELDITVIREKDARQIPEQEELSTGKNENDQQTETKPENNKTPEVEKDTSSKDDNTNTNSNNSNKNTSNNNSNNTPSSSENKETSKEQNTTNDTTSKEEDKNSAEAKPNQEEKQPEQDSQKTESKTENKKEKNDSSTKIISRFGWRVSELTRYIVIGALIVAISICLVVVDKKNRR